MKRHFLLFLLILIDGSYGSLRRQEKDPEEQDENASFKLEILCKGERVALDYSTSFATKAIGMSSFTVDNKVVISNISVQRSFALEYNVVKNTVVQFTHSGEKHRQICLRFYDKDEVCYQMNSARQQLWRIGNYKVGPVKKIQFKNDAKDDKSVEKSVIGNIGVYDTMSSALFDGCYSKRQIDRRIQDIDVDLTFDTCYRTCLEKNYESFTVNYNKDNKKECVCVIKKHEHRANPTLFQFENGCNCVHHAQDSNKICIYHTESYDIKSALSDEHEPGEKLQNEKINMILQYFNMNVDTLRKSGPQDLHERLNKWKNDTCGSIAERIINTRDVHIPERISDKRIMVDSTSGEIMRAKLSFNFDSGNQELEPSNQEIYPDIGYSNIVHGSEGIEIEGTLTLEYNLNIPLLIEKDTYLSFSCVRKDINSVLKELSICLGDTCIHLAGSDVQDNLLEYIYGGRVTNKETQFKIPIGIKEFGFNQDVNRIKLVQVVNSVEPARKKQSYSGKIFGFIQSANPKKKVLTDMASISFSKLDESSDSTFYACGMKVTKTRPLELKVKWCNYHSWVDQRDSSSFDESKNCKMCDVDHYIYALRSRRSYSAANSDLKEIEFVCTKKDWSTTIKRTIEIDPNEWRIYKPGCHSWSKWFSEGTGGNSDKPNRGKSGPVNPITSIECSESNCNNKRLCSIEHIILEPNTVVGWTDYRNSDSTSSVACGIDHLVTEIQCREADCGWMRIGCQIIKENFRITTIGWSNLLSSSGIVDCGVGSYLSGIKCYNYRCRSIKLRCSKVEEYSTEASIRSWYHWKGYSDAYIKKIEWNDHNIQSTFSWVPCGKELCSPKNVMSQFSNFEFYKPADALIDTGVDSVTISLYESYPFDAVPYLIVTATIQTSSTEVDKDKTIGRSIAISNDSRILQLDGLTPGKRYDFKLTPVDENEDELDTVKGKVFTSAVIPCSCTIKNNEKSGAPTQVEVTQNMGYVFLTFVDNSKCEEAFAIQRKDGKNVYVLAPSYYFFVEENCGDSVAPGKDFADDLSRSKLTIGQSYEYCVSSIASSYMAQLPTDTNDEVKANLPFRVSSDATCVQYSIQWESSVIVKVTLKKEAGAQPVKDVIISWSLRNSKDQEITTGTDTTPKNGLILIQFKLTDSEFNDENSNKNINDYKLVVTPSKSSITENVVIAHTFLCGDERIECSGGSEVYLKHLTFENEINFADETSVPIFGKIFVADTQDSCSIKSARVCLNKKLHHEFVSTGVCVDSDRFGNYEIPATIGTTVTLAVTYMNHTFEAIEDRRNDMINGIQILVDRLYNNYHFYDVEKINLIIDIAGGECNKTIGTSGISISISGCRNWEKIVSQSSFRQSHNVPAHLINIEVDSVKWKSSNQFQIQKFFSIHYGKQLVDLRELTSTTRSTTFIPENFALSRNNNIGIISDFPSEYIISFDLKPQNKITTLGNILRFASSNCCDYGYLNPGIWFNPNSYMVKFSTMSRDENEIDLRHNFGNVGVVNENQWNSFKIVALRDLVLISINNNINHLYIPLANRPTLQDVKVYASDDQTPADASLRDVIFSPIDQTNLESNSVSFSTNNVNTGTRTNLGRIERPSKQYIIDFVLHPLETISAASSIIRLSNIDLQSSSLKGILDLKVEADSYNLLMIADNEQQGNIAGVNENQDNNIKIVSDSYGTTLYINGEERSRLERARLQSIVRYDGFCVKVGGNDQNDGVVAIGEGKNYGESYALQNECKVLCMKYANDNDIKITGCEAIWGQGNRDCYIHTQHIDRGNNRDRHTCWIVSKADDKFQDNNYLDVETAYDSSNGVIRGLVYTAINGNYPELRSDPKYVRFQYNGTLVMETPTISIDKIENRTCARSGLPQSCDDAKTSCTNNVVSTGQTFTTTIILKNELINDQVFCDIVDETILLRIQNNLGLDPKDSQDAAYISKLNKIYNKDQIDLLSKCTGGGCTVIVQHDMDEVTNIKSRARIEEPFIAGHPTVQGNHKKTLTVSAMDTVHHLFHVVVTGDKEIQGGKSFGFPTHYPLLVIRDPPGGNSFVAYENVLTTIVMHQTTLERYISLEGSLDASLGAGPHQEACFGLGASICSLVFEGGTILGAQGSTESSFLIDFDDETNSHQFTSTWSFTTSDEPEFAGKESDVALIPNINVEFREVRRVSWDSTECTASMKEIFVYDLISPNNKAAFSYLTFSLIKSKTIPELEELLKSIEEDKGLAEAKSEQTRDRDDKEYIEKYKFLQEAVTRWDLFIENYDKATEDIKYGKLEKSNDWFSSRIGTGEVTFDDRNIADKHNWKGMVPKEFDETKKSNFTGEYTIPPGVPIDTFENINRVQFSGGGNALEFTMSDSQLKDVLNLDPGFDIEKEWPTILAGALVGGVFLGPIGVKAGLVYGLASMYNNLDWNDQIGSSANFKINLGGFETKLEGSISSAYSGSERAYEGTSTEKETSITLVLGDPDSSDEFALDIYLDKTYKTFIFDVRSGVSSCPWEGEPTVRLEDPMIEQQGLALANVAADQPITFKIKMWNRQNTVLPNLVPLEVILDPSSNPNDLRIEMFGTDMQNPHQFNFDGGKSIEADIVVYRGPTEYEYAPLKISLRSQCESVYPLTTGKHERLYSLSNSGEKISFLKPCPQVRWAGGLLRDGTFVINTVNVGIIDVTIFNLNANTKSLYKQTMEKPLNIVMLRYRQEGGGNGDWENAIISGNTNNFAQNGLEDAYGYATLHWDASSIADGNYEIKVECDCRGASTASLPEEYKVYSTEFIKGIVDQNVPTVFGNPTIKDNRHVQSNKKVTIIFSEDVDCKQPYDFDIGITSFSANSENDIELSNQDLQIKCVGDIMTFIFLPSVRNTLEGRSASLTLKNLQDLAGNEMENYEVNFAFADQNHRHMEEHNKAVTRGMGCDGVDQNSDNVIDECNEDQTPPSVSMHGVHVFHNPKYPDVPFLQTPAFSTVKDAKAFLTDNLVTSDDCAHDLELIVSSPEASCDETMFDVTVADPRCGEINPIQILTTKYILRVDDIPPIVSVGFDPASKPLFYDDKKNILFVEESSKSFVNVFWYKVEDNCRQKLNVDVTVMSNENSYDKPMVMMRKKKNIEQESRLQVYIEPSSCKTKEETTGEFCEWNLDIPIRFYEIRFQVTDYGGNVADTAATVVVVPKANDGTHFVSKKLEQKGLYNEKYFEYIMEKNSERYVLETATMEWDVL